MPLHLRARGCRFWVRLLVQTPAELPLKIPIWQAAEQGQEIVQQCNLQLMWVGQTQV